MVLRSPRRIASRVWCTRRRRHRHTELRRTSVAFAGRRSLVSNPVSRAVPSIAGHQQDFVPGFCPAVIFCIRLPPHPNPVCQTPDGPSPIDNTRFSSSSKRTAATRWRRTQNNNTTSYPLRSGKYVNTRVYKITERCIVWVERLALRRKNSFDGNIYFSNNCHHCIPYFGCSNVFRPTLLISTMFVNGSNGLVDCIR